MLYSIAIALVSLTLVACEKQPPPPKVPQQALDFYAGRKVFERPVTVAGNVRGIPDVRSETCGACHTEIYAEWKISTHARAWLDDDQFQAELHKTATSKDDASWLCINCHTPAVEQLERLVVGLEDGQIGKPKYVANPTFDAALQKDAIGCATCHVEDGKIYGPWGNTRAPHPVAKRESLLTEEVCTRCHQAEQFYESINLGCFFDTGKTFAASPQAKSGQVCQDCHMPEVERPLMPGLPARKTRRHWFGGSLIPKKPAYAAELEPLEDVFGHGVSIAVEPWTSTHDELLAGQPPMAEVDTEIAATEVVACSGDCRSFAVVVTNDRAGHTVPTGDPERHIDVRAEAKADGEVVGRAWTRIGSRYQWWPKTVRLSDTRIRPGEKRVLRVDAPVGSTLEVLAHKYRMYESAFEHHALEGKVVRGRQFHRSELAVD